MCDTAKDIRGLTSSQKAFRKVLVSDIPKSVKNKNHKYVEYIFDMVLILWPNTVVPIILLIQDNYPTAPNIELEKMMKRIIDKFIKFHDKIPEFQDAFLLLENELKKRGIQDLVDRIQEYCKEENIQLPSSNQKEPRKKGIIIRLPRERSLKTWRPGRKMISARKARRPARSRPSCR